MSTRRQARAFGKRHLNREAGRIVGRVLELDAAGHPVPTIASSVGIGTPAASWILRREREMRTQRGEGRSY